MATLMKVFSKSEIKKAERCALDGGQALLVQNIDQARLYDRDAKRLGHLAVRLGVWGKVRIETEGMFGQYVELTGKPLERACEIFDRALTYVPYERAMPVAEMLINTLGPLCRRIYVSGELRREETEIHGIDILAETRVDSFTQALPSDVDDLLRPMLREDLIRYEKFDTCSKKFYVLSLGIWAHVYLVIPPATWGVRSIQMTGPDDFSHWMMSRRKTGGALPNHLVIKNGAVYDRFLKRKLQTPEEADFFELCGWPYIRPQSRVARWSK